MRAPCLLIACVVSLSLLVASCAGSLAGMSVADVNCPASQITVGNERSGNYERTWNATCRGQVFDCSVQLPVLSVNADAYCVPTRRDVPGQYPRANTATAPHSAAEVKRGYDEDRDVHFVTGRFRVARGMHVIVSGAPKLATDTLVVTLSGISFEPTIRECRALEVLINGQALTTTSNEHVVADTRVKIESRVAFSALQLPPERSSTFGVGACGTTWAFTSQQLEQLRGLLAIYADLAQAAQDPASNRP